MTIYPYLKVLKNFDFTKLWISQICSQLANYLLSFAILLRVFKLTNSSAAVAAIIVAFGLATVAFGAMAGVYADRFDRKWILTVTNFLQALTVAAFLFVPQQVIWLALVTFIYSSLNQFYLPAEAPSIPNLVASEDLLVANSYFAFTGSVALIIGFAAAGPVVAMFGYSAIYLITIILLLIATVATLILPKLAPHNLSGKWISDVVKEFWQGLAHFWQNYKLRFPLLSLLMIQVINGMLITITPAFISVVLKANLERGAFLLMAPFGLGVLVGSLTLGLETNYISKRKQVLIGFVGMGIMVMLLSRLESFESKYFPYTIFAVLTGIFNAHIFAPSHSILQTYALERFRGRVYATLYTLMQMAATLPTFIVGFLADKASVAIVIFMLGIFLIVFGFLGQNIKTATTA